VREHEQEVKAARPVEFGPGQPVSGADLHVRSVRAAPPARPLRPPGGCSLPPGDERERRIPAGCAGPPDAGQGRSATITDSSWLESKLVTSSVLPPGSDRQHGAGSRRQGDP
jgi:hypothetical protein